MITIVFGVFSRVLLSWLINSDVPSLSSSPIENWLAVEEAQAWKKYNVETYEADLIHQAPLALYFWSFISIIFNGSSYLSVLLIDTLCAYALSKTVPLVCRQLLQQQKVAVSGYSTKSIDLLLKSDSCQQTCKWSIYCYYLNPYGIVSFASRSTAVLPTLVLIAVLYYICKEEYIFASIMCALASYLLLYPVILLIPLVIAAQNNPKNKDQGMLVQMSVFSASLAGLLLLSRLLVGSWNFVDSVYIFKLTAPDHMPSLSIFWYLFAEMFDHFRTFFLWIFQINVFVHSIPLTMRFQKDVVFLFYSLLFVQAVMKPYPSCAELGLLVSLLPLWRHIFSFMKQTFLLGCALVATLLLMPLMHYLWLYVGSANSNFYFSVSLAHCLVLVMLLSDLLVSYTKRDYFLKHGPPPHKLSDDTELVLKYEGLVWSDEDATKQKPKSS